ncbi:hypothetical protein EDB19DRAFT_1827173 [Suillus lakei]|nr:hypothetical protein EDB19DRAFT_1827173 [Suillus lakei]
MEQAEWLQERLPQYMTEHLKDKDYSHFWPVLHAEWFKQFPEEAVTFPNIPADTLSAEQNAAVDTAKAKWKSQLRTWFRWRANTSKKNCSLKKQSTVFNDALQPKRRAKSEAEIYSDIYYDKRIKPLVKAEEEAGHVTSGGRITLSRKFSKELLDDEEEDVKAQIHEMGIDDLPIICRQFAHLVRKKTGFIMSFMFAGPDLRSDWDMTSLSCHPSETSQRRNFAQLYQMADRMHHWNFKLHTRPMCDATYITYIKKFDDKYKRAEQVPLYYVTGVKRVAETHRAYQEECTFRYQYAGGRRSYNARKGNGTGGSGRKETMHDDCKSIASIDALQLYQFLHQYDRVAWDGRTPLANYAWICLSRLISIPFLNTHSFKDVQFLGLPVIGLVIGTVPYFNLRAEVSHPMSVWPQLTPAVIFDAMTHSDKDH